MEMGTDGLGGVRVAGGDTPRIDPSDEGRWRALILLGVAMVLSMATWFSAAAVLPQLRDNWNLSRVAGSWLTIMVQIGFVVGAVGSAYLGLADRLSERRLMLLGAIGAALANAGLAVSGGLVAALPFRFLVGVSLAGVYPPSLKAMSTWFRRDRGTALGVMVGALTLGSALPHLVNGFGGLDWKLVVYATSLLTLAGGLLAEFLVEDGPYRFPTARFDWRDARRALAARGVRLSTLGYVGHMWELYAMWAWFGAFFADVLARDGGEVSTVAVGLATFSVIGAGALGSWAGGAISDRHGRAEAAGLSMAFSGAVAAVIGFLAPAGPWVILALGLVWGFWVVADSAQFSTVVTEQADQRFVGSVLTAQLAAGFILSIFTIFLVPVVRDSLGWGWAFLMLAPGPALGMWAMNSLRNQPRPAAANARP